MDQIATQPEARTWRVSSGSTAGDPLAAFVGRKLWAIDRAPSLVWRLLYGGGGPREERAIESLNVAAARATGGATCVKGAVFLLLMAFFTYIPFGVEQFDCLSGHWTDIKPCVFGAHVRDLPPVLRERVGGTGGVLVRAVVKNSPAYCCDILKGDVVKEIGGIDVCDVRGFFLAVDRFAGQKVQVVILRDGKRLEKEIVLGT